MYELFFPSIREKALRVYIGQNTHIMLLTPSNEVLEKIVYHARDGIYVPYTNTEQDVLEAIFNSDQFTAAFSDANAALLHLHGRNF
jgi:hypothetical protein